MLFDPTAGALVPHDPVAAAAAFKKAGWTRAADGWHLRGAKNALTIELLSPDRVSNPVAYDAAEAIAHDWKGIGIGVTHVALAPGAFATDRLATGNFTAAVGDVAIGLDPDLYPLLASSQTVRGGSNVIGLQDAVLDELLVAARGRSPTPTGRRPTRRSRSGSSRRSTCSRWPSPTSRSWSTTRSRDRPSGRSPTRLTDSGMC